MNFSTNLQADALVSKPWDRSMAWWGKTGPASPPFSRRFGTQQGGSCRARDAGGFHFANFVTLILMISLGFAVVNYYDAPIPWILARLFIISSR